MTEQEAKTVLDYLHLQRENICGRIAGNMIDSIYYARKAELLPHGTARKNMLIEAEKAKESLRWAKILLKVCDECIETEKNGKKSSSGN